MSLYTKSLFSFSILFFLLVTTLFFFSFSHLKHEILTAAKQEAKHATGQLETMLMHKDFAAKNLAIAADAVFSGNRFTHVHIEDFVGNTLYDKDFSSTSQSAGMLAQTVAGFTSTPVTVNFKGSGDKNLAASITPDKKVMQQKIMKEFYTLFVYFALAYIVAVILTALLFKSLLQPLQALRKQIFHLKEGKFIENREYPKTQDLRELVVMLNESVVNLKSKFKKDTEMLNRYYELIYNDDQTGLHNRSYFMMHLSTELENKTSHESGVVVFIKITNYDQLNKAHSYNQINDALQTFSAQLQNTDLGYTILARIKPDTFAYLFTEHSLSQIKQHIDKQYHQLEEKLQNKFKDMQTSIAISMSEYEKGESTKSLLSRLDTALNEAMIKTDNKKIAITGHGHKALSKEERIDLIEYAFNNDGFNIELRPIQDLKEDKKSFLKVLVYIVDREENSYSKREFFSILYEKGLVADYNKKVLDKICSRYRMINHKITAMVTISSDFIGSLDHIRWLGNKLEELRQNPNIKICFTIKDDVAQQEIDKMIQFAKLVYRFGHYIAISGFTLAQEKLTYLQRIKPRFIIVDQDYVEKLYFEDKSRVKALQFMISEAGAQTIIAYVDDPKMVTSLHELDVHYLLSANYKGEY
ncbi:MAG: EAL domain-containing protein [Campylobacterota bacterium]